MKLNVVVDLGSVEALADDLGDALYELLFAHVGARRRADRAQVAVSDELLYAVESGLDELWRARLTRHLEGRKVALGVVVADAHIVLAHRRLVLRVVFQLTCERQNT